MNIPRTLLPFASRTSVAVSARNSAVARAPQVSDRYRERDFGIGYGNSSGYALEKRYTSDWGQARFRFS